MSLAPRGHDQIGADRPRPDGCGELRLRQERLDQALARIQEGRARPAPSPILPEAYRPTSLARDVQDLCDPGQPLDEALLVGLAGVGVLVAALRALCGLPGARSEESGRA